jgi:molybdopterin-guanine dinucleotide biosynthesis protein A
MRSAAILAGGRATRFDGRDKGALVVNGRPILQRLIGELSAAADDLMIVGRAGALPDDAGATSPRVVADIVPGCGPLGGLHAALTEMRGERLFVVACDMPYVTAPLVDYLFTLAGDAPAVVPKTDRGYHPLCAVYARECLAVVTAHLAERRFALRELFETIPTRVVTADELGRFGAPPQLLANVNTPAEYARLEALQGHKL